LKLYCPNCGEEIPKKDKFCKYCGKPLENLESEKNLSFKGLTTKYHSLNPNDKLRLKNLSIILIIVVIVLASMGAIIYYTALNQTVDLGSEGKFNLPFGYEVDEENSNNDMLLMNNFRELTSIGIIPGVDNQQDYQAITGYLLVGQRNVYINGLSVTEEHYSAPLSFYKDQYKYYVVKEGKQLTITALMSNDLDWSVQKSDNPVNIIISTLH